MSNTTQITISFQGAPTPQQIAAQLRFQAGLLEGMEPKAAASRKNTDAAPVTAKTAKPAPEKEVDADEDDDFGKAEKKTKQTKAARQAAASFEDDEDASEATDTETTETDDAGGDDDFMEAAPAKSTKKSSAKKLTVNDVNDACKAKAQASDRKTVLGILKKKFGVTSVTELKADQYAAVVEAMAV